MMQNKIIPSSDVKSIKEITSNMTILFGSKVRLEIESADHKNDSVSISGVYFSERNQRNISAKLYVNIKESSLNSFKRTLMH